MPHTLRMTLVRIDDLHGCLAAVFERHGLTREDAGGLAGLLVDSELRGHPDHGIAVLALLTGLYSDGKMNPRPQVRVLRETDGALLLDGDRGCGPGAPTRAMTWCIERARERKGMAVATVRDWQLLVAAPYVRLAAEAGLIGFACTNFVPFVAPPGGRTKTFGTNPLAYGLPAERHPPVVLDMATTVVAMQKVRVAAAAGEPMPEGLIFDRAGRPTTDPDGVLRGRFARTAGEPARAPQGLRPGPLRRCAERRPERSGLRAGRGRRRPGMLSLGARRRRVPAAYRVRGADRRAGRPGQAGRAGSRRRRAARPGRARRAAVPGAHRPRRGAAGAGEPAHADGGLRGARRARRRRVDE